MCIIFVGGGQEGTLLQEQAGGAERGSEEEKEAQAENVTSYFTFSSLLQVAQDDQIHTKADLT